MTAAVEHARGADAGPGIPPDEQAVVWEELARGRALHSTGRGTSVQLYLVPA